MIRVKKGVVFKAFRHEIMIVIQLLHYVSLFYKTDIWITSANDSKHRENSYHYDDLAIDIRTRNLSPGAIKHITERMFVGKFMQDIANVTFRYPYWLEHEAKKRFYDVVLEKDHIHIEFDMRRYEKEKGNERP